MADTFEVQLRRMETSQPWGFRLRGGTDQGMPLFVEHVCTCTVYCQLIIHSSLLCVDLFDSLPDQLSLAIHPWTGTMSSGDASRPSGF